MSSHWLIIHALFQTGRPSHTPHYPQLYHANVPYPLRAMLMKWQHWSASSPHTWINMQPMLTHSHQYFTVLQRCVGLLPIIWVIRVCLLLLPILPSRSLQDVQIWFQPDLGSSSSLCLPHSESQEVLGKCQRSIIAGVNLEVDCEQIIWKC